MSTPRFNLRNASLFLSKLKNKYSNGRLSQQNRDNTFIDQEEELTSSDGSLKKKSSHQRDSKSDRLISPNQQECKIQKEQLTKNPPNKEIKQELTDLKSPCIQKKGISSSQVSKNSQGQQQTQFCDLIIIKYLQQTLSVYKNDLQTLEHNRENLEQEIYFLGKKISKLNQISIENVRLQNEIEQLNQQLKSTIRIYHETNCILWKQKLKMATKFNQLRNKIKNHFLLAEQQSDDLNHFLITDSLAQGYNDQYQAFIQFKRLQQSQISRRIRADQQTKSQIETQNHKLFEKIFQSKQQIYLRQIVQPQTKQPSNQQLRLSALPNLKQKQKNVILYDDVQQQNPITQSKPKDKTKKLSQSERAALLGDLKSFSKSFKLPK